jgi:hypothetical protein
MLVLLMPEDVSSNFMIPLLVTTIRAGGLHCPIE